MSSLTHELSHTLNLTQLAEIIAMKLSGYHGAEKNDALTKIHRDIDLKMYTLKADLAFPEQDIHKNIEGLLVLLDGDTWNNIHFEFNADTLKFLEIIDIINILTQQSNNNILIKATNKLSTLLSEFKDANNRYDLFAINSKLKALVLNSIN